MSIFFVWFRVYWGCRGRCLSYVNSCPRMLNVLMHHILKFGCSSTETPSSPISTKRFGNMFRSGTTESLSGKVRKKNSTGTLPPSIGLPSNQTKQISIDVMQSPPPPLTPDLFLNSPPPSPSITSGYLEMPSSRLCSPSSIHPSIFQFPSRESCVDSASDVRHVNPSRPDQLNLNEEQRSSSGFRKSNFMWKFKHQLTRSLSIHRGGKELSSPDFETPNSDVINFESGQAGRQFDSKNRPALFLIFLVLSRLN